LTQRISVSDRTAARAMQRRAIRQRVAQKRSAEFDEDVPM